MLDSLFVSYEYYQCLFAFSASISFACDYEELYIRITCILVGSADLAPSFILFTYAY